MATSESDLKEQLADLDWGTGAAVAVQVAPEPDQVTAGSAENVSASAEADPLDMDVSVAGVTTRAPGARRRRGGRRAATAAAAPVEGEAQEAEGVHRRGRKTPPDVLSLAGESPAVVALFDAMWKDVGSKLARGIGRPKASRQDAAIGWYALLLAMRERDALK